MVKDFGDFNDLLLRFEVHSNLEIPNKVDRYLTKNDTKKLC